MNSLDLNRVIKDLGNNKSMFPFERTRSPRALIAVSDLDLCLVFSLAVAAIWRDAQLKVSVLLESANLVMGKKSLSPPCSVLLFLMRAAHFLVCINVEEFLMVLNAGYKFIAIGQSLSSSLLASSFSNCELTLLCSLFRRAILRNLCFL